MSIIITLSAEHEALLRSKAAQHDQEVDLFASSLLTNLLAEEQQDQDLEESLRSLQQSSADFAAGRYRSFSDFAEEQRQKYHLPTNP